MSGHILPVIFFFHFGEQLNDVAGHAGKGGLDPDEFGHAWARGARDDRRYLRSQVERLGLGRDVTLKTGGVRVERHASWPGRRGLSSDLGVELDEIASGSRKNTVRCRKAGSSLGGLRIGTPLASREACESSIAGGGTRKAAGPPPSRRRPGLRPRPGRAARPQREQARSDPEAHPGRPVHLQCKAQGLEIERPRLGQAAAEQDDVIEIGYRGRVHR